MTQYVVQNETSYNTNTPMLNSLVTDLGSYDGHEAVMASYQDEPPIAENGNLAMLDAEQGVFYAYGDADGTGTSQLFVISEVLDEDTGQLIKVAIPIMDDYATTTAEVSSTEHDFTPPVVTQSDAILENTGTSETVDQLLLDARVDLTGTSAEPTEFLHTHDSDHTSTELSPYVISRDAETDGFDMVDTALSFNVEGGNGDDNQTTEITVKEEGLEEGSEEQTTTEFQIVQLGNRVIVRNSEGKIVNEFPLPTSPNLLETETPPFNPSETDAMREPDPVKIDANLTKSQSASSPSPRAVLLAKTTPEPNICQPLKLYNAPVVRGKRVYPGKFDRKNLVNSEGTSLTSASHEEPHSDPEPCLPPKSKVVVTQLNNSSTDADSSEKLDLPFCYSGQKFSIQSQKLILNVYDFFKKVNKGTLPSLQCGSPAEKAATVLNVSAGVISRVNKRLREGSIDFTKELQPQRKEGLKRVVDVISVDNEKELRTIIHDFAKQGITPTVPVLLQEATQRIGFSGSRSSLRRILHRMGFKYAKINKKSVIISIVKEDQRPTGHTTLASTPSAATPNSGNAPGTPVLVGSLNKTQTLEPPVIKFYYGPLDDEPKQAKGLNGPIPNESVAHHTHSAGLL